MDVQLNNAPAGFFSLTDSGLLLDVNETFSTMLEYEKDELLNLHIESFMSNPNKFFFHTYFYPYIRLYGIVEEMYLLLKTRSGKNIPILLFGKKCEQDGEEMIICVCVHIPKRVEYEKEIRSISTKIEEAYREKDEVVEKLNLMIEENEKKNHELTILNSQLETLATTDMLTGLYNRQFFIKSLAAHITTFDNENVPFSLAILDIDFFKTVNDTWGHLVGDKTLVQFADVMRSVFSEETVLVRYGGEEFIVLLPGITQAKSMAVAEKLRTVVENTDWGDCFITVSIGISTYTSGDSEQTVLAKADRALYVSKDRGRNCVTHSNELKEY